MSKLKRIAFPALPLAVAMQWQAPPARAVVGSLAWPVRGPVIRSYEAPFSQYSSGHRGIDIAVAYGSPVRAASDGSVYFAGSVAGSLYVTLDHGGGLRTTYSWLSEVVVKKGDTVAVGDIIGYSGWGHPGVDPPHLHFGVKQDGEYVDPLPMLVRAGIQDLIRLAPL
jgi:murein DD-endopeptidase MepM/ murein hydrolase activator NlpD